MYSMTHSYLCHDHDSFTFVPWRITCTHLCNTFYTFAAWLDTFVPWLFYVCSLSVAFTFVPWLVHICAMTRSYVCHDSFICVRWHVHMCAMTRSWVCLICDIHRYKSCIHVCTALLSMHSTWACNSCTYLCQDSFIASFIAFYSHI